MEKKNFTRVVTKTYPSGRMEISFILRSTQPQKNLKDFYFGRHVYTKRCERANVKGEAEEEKKEKFFQLGLARSANLELFTGLRMPSSVYFCLCFEIAKKIFGKSRRQKSAINCTLKLPNHYNRKCIAVVFQRLESRLGALPNGKLAPRSSCLLAGAHNKASPACLADPIRSRDVHSTTAAYDENFIRVGIVKIINCYSTCSSQSSA